MEVYKEGPRRFLPTLPRSEPILVDHTALYAAKSCPRKYFFQIVLGRVPRETPLYFAFGSAYHKFREILEGVGRGSDSDSQGSLDRRRGHAMGAAVMAFVSSDVESSTSDSKWDYLTVDRLKQCCEVAFEYWKQEKERGDVRVLATEQPFNIALPDGRFRAGRADQIVLFLGDVYGRDFKTTSKAQGWYARSIEPNEQFLGYTWAESRLTGSVVKGQLVEVLFNEKGKDPYIHPFLVEYTPEQLNRFESEHLVWNKMIDLWRENDIYPMNESHCTFCAYRQVCTKKTERAMLYTLENEYDHRPWDCATIHLGKTDMVPQSML